MPVCVWVCVCAFSLTTPWFLNLRILQCCCCFFFSFFFFVFRIFVFFLTLLPTHYYIPDQNFKQDTIVSDTRQSLSTKKFHTEHSENKTGLFKIYASNFFSFFFFGFLTPLGRVNQDVLRNGKTPQKPFCSDSTEFAYNIILYIHMYTRFGVNLTIFPQ